MKKAKVFYNDILCGYLIENDDGYTFYYIDEYLKKSNSKAISLTLLLKDEPYHSMELFPFFDGLIPEGYLFNLAVKIYNINPFNRFDVLLKTCADTIGCVSIKEDLDNE